MGVRDKIGGRVLRCNGHPVSADPVLQNPPQAGVILSPRKRTKNDTWGACLE